MRLYKCKKVEKHLIKANLVDDRHIWCYAQMKANILKQETTPIYGMVLVCIKGEYIYMYITEFNSTKLNLLYLCNINKIKDVKLNKKLLSMRFTFKAGSDSFQLDMDDWKRFSSVLGN